MSGKEQVIEVENLPLDIITGATYFIRQSNPNSYTHGMFKYPCKFIPEVPRWALKKYLLKRGAIFDPFVGSGTTLLEANINGIDAYGTEIDDVAKLITRVKTRKMSSEQMKTIQICYEDILHVIENVNYPKYRPEINNLEHWFPAKTIEELGRIRSFIGDIHDTQVREFFMVCMASIIKKVSYADDTSPKPYVSTKILKEPPTVKKEFDLTTTRYMKMLYELNNVDYFGRCEIIEGNALDFKLNKKIELAITSPPYINAFDYGRTMRLENLWMGLLTEESLRSKKASYVGTEKIKIIDEEKKIEILNHSNLLKQYYKILYEHDRKRALVVKKFFEDMKINMELIYDNLNEGGKYVIVIGNSTIRKVNIESWKVLEEIGISIGFKPIENCSYIIQNPYIRIPRNGLGGKITKDYILVLQKGA